MKFVIAGASKSGSEWLLACLHEHPEVFMAPSSTDFFSRYYDRGMDWYLNHFKEATDEHKVVGEKSTSYIIFPDCPERIHQWAPDAKLLFVLRDPVARAFSHYCMHLRAEQVSSDIQDVLKPGHMLVEEGKYYANIQRFVRLFGEDQIHVMFHDDLSKDDTGFLVEVLRYIGVDDSVRPSLLGKKLHVRRTRPRSVKLFLFASRTFTWFSGLGGWARRIMQFARTSGMVNLFHRLNRGESYPPFTASHKRELAEYYRDDIEKLSNWTGRDLSHWVQKYNDDSK
jgi:hypothetical protein